MSEPCLVCGCPGVDRHHPTGRGPDGHYLDGEFRVWGCHDHHELWHDDLRSADVDDLARGSTAIEMVEVSLRRTGVFLGGLATDGALGELVRFIARLCATWADRLARTTAALDAYDPGWRAAPGLDAA